jgi:hypothetical protein
VLLRVGWGAGERNPTPYQSRWRGRSDASDISNSALTIACRQELFSHNLLIQLKLCAFGLFYENKSINPLAFSCALEYRFDCPGGMNA